MTVEQKISEINTAIQAQIDKLRIALPEDVDKLWKVKLYGKCEMWKNMDKGSESLLQRPSKEWVVADDSLDFVVAHIYPKGGGRNEGNFVVHNANSSNEIVRMKLLVHSSKEQAFQLVNEALKSIKLKKEVTDRNTFEIVSEYMISKDSKWGVNPDYNAMIIEYESVNPYIETPDYTVID